MKYVLVDQSEQLSKFISPRNDKDKPIYNWHSFKHSFSKELVDVFIKEFELDEKSTILDPFCGGGITLIAAKQKGISSAGYDISPFAVFLTKTKLNSYRANKLEQDYNRLLFILENKKSLEEIELPDIPIIKKAFSKTIWNELHFIKDVISKNLSSKNRNFYILALLSILESVSNTTKAGAFLRITKRKVKRGDATNKFLHYAQKMINDREISKKLFGKKCNSEVKVGDARRLKEKRLFDAIITSPPYPNRHDYTRIYSLELILHFLNNNNKLKKLRYDTLRSHVEARKKYSAGIYIQPLQLTKLIKRISRNGLNNNQILEMLQGYFEDMYLSLSEMQRLLKKGGKIALVVSNVRFSGVNIPVDKLLADIGEQVGLKVKEIRIARYRGNSAQQMRDYNKKLSRESIIIWKKKF